MPRNRHLGDEAEIDRKIGRAIRTRRKLMRMTQDELAGACGLTFQQVQKYEYATSRIAASRLVSIARVLRVPVSEFYAAVEPV